MARKSNSEITSGAIVVSYSLQRELKPNLAVVAEALKLRSVSELISLIALEPDATIAALAPLAEKMNAHRAQIAAVKAKQKETIAKLKDLSPSDLEAALAHIQAEKAS
ncbi:hypothetical protein D9M72_172870 [compost metagenome]